MNWVSDRYRQAILDDKPPSRWCAAAVALCWEYPYGGGGTARCARCPAADEEEDET